MTQLVALLQKTKKDLKAYSHVNKKALDQYVHFKEQREKLEERKVEIDNSQTAIRDLITALDQKKDAAIERTYKMVAKYFTEVFAQLTGEGIVWTLILISSLCYVEKFFINLIRIRSISNAKVCA